MNFPPTFLVTLARLLRRDGFSFFGKCARYALSRDAWLWLLRGGDWSSSVVSLNHGCGHETADPSLSVRQLLDDERLIAESEWFDKVWFLREHPEAKHSGMSPARYYLTHDPLGTVYPGPDFIGEEYLALNADVKMARLNPLLHFEKYRAKRYRQISFLENPKVSFPAEARELRKDFSPKNSHHRRVAVFAAFSGNGRISATDIYYLKGLATIVDSIIYVSNNPVFPEELEKLDGLVRVALFQHHGEYDFGSYKRGFFIAKEFGLLDRETTDELILANNSCYGPVVPFEETLQTMSHRKCDFWGLTAYDGFGHEHIQSYFFVFRRRVLDGSELECFLASVKREIDRWHVISRYETQLTDVLVKAGYRADTLVPWKFYRNEGSDLVFPPARPVTLLRRYRMPLVKVKTVNGENDEGLDALMAALYAENPELSALIHPKIGDGGVVSDRHQIVKTERLRHSDNLVKSVHRISEKARSGKKIDVVFLVFSESMFPAKPLFDAMMRDAAFVPRVIVIPDMRWADAKQRFRHCFEALRTSIPESRLHEARHEEWSDWDDEIGSCDLVCFPSPYDVSVFLYNPHWAVGRNFLPIHVNYGFYRSKYDRDIMGRQNYAYFWKAYFECEATAKEYAEYSILKGANAEVVGYVKMDALAAAKPWPRNGNRKRVLIAPHHSVEGGANDTLALSNFQRYADYFLALPEKHPELDFVFRPHPFLFTVLASPSKWGQKKVDGWIARMKAHPNVRWSDDGDYFPVFASCDACVQDCGSYLVEWFYTGKPCCYLLKDPSDIDAKFAPLGKDCLSHCYLAYDEGAIESFLRDVVEGGNDPKAAARDEFRKSVMVNYPHAAEAALASIKKALGME